MKKNLSLATLASLFLLPLTCRPQLINPPAYVTGAKTINISQRSLDLTAADNARNQWLFGSIGSSSINSDPAKLVCDNDTTIINDELDVFVTKMDPLGKFKFSKTFGTDKIEFLNGFALDPTGNAALFFQGGGTSTVNGTTYPAGTHYVYHLNENGEMDWLRTLYGAIFIDSRNSNVLMADNGDVIVSGVILPLSAGTVPTADFGDTIIDKKTNPQLFIIRYAKADGAMKMRIYDVPEEMEIAMVHKGINDEIWLNINIFNAQTFTIDGHQLNLNNEGGIAMLRLNGQAEFLGVDNYFTKSYFTDWSPLPDGTIRGIAFCNQDAVEKASGNDINNTQFNRPMLFSMGADGKLDWIKPVIGQYHYLDVNLANGDALVTNQANLAEPAFSIYNSDGDLLQSTILQSEYNRFSFTANFDADSAVYISSMVNRDLTVNGTKYSFGEIQDIAFVIAKLPYRVNTASTIDFSFCVPYTFHGLTITESGTYTVVIPNSYNGDSTITLNFTKIPTTYSDIQIKQCISYTSPSGKVFTQSGVYQDTILNASGCDSILSITLTIDETQIQLWGTAGNCAGGGGAIYTAALCGSENAFWPLPLDAQGANPIYTELLPYNGRLYGMNSEGGAKGFGMIFSYDPLLEDYRTEFSFDNAVEGANPQGSLTLAANGKMYGFIKSQTVFNFGGIIEFDPVSRACLRRVSFTIDKGWRANGKFIDGGDGKLYGVTIIGGSKSMGAIISYVPGESSYTKLADFDGVEHGSYPILGLCKADGAKFYITTSEGGSAGKGAISEFDISTATLSKLTDFTGANGTAPYGTLTKTSTGKYFGMTSKGGSSDRGVVYSFDPLTALISVQVDFPSNASGAMPYGNLMEASNGLLYGFTSSGGAKNDGILFSFNPSTTDFNIVANMDYQGIGSKPQGTPVEVEGRLYGMNNYGGSQYRGTLIGHDIGQNTTVKKIDLEKPTSGAKPTGKLLLSENGKFYGTTKSGGAFNYGVLFSFDPQSQQYVALKNFEIFNSGSSSTDGLIETRSGKIYGISGSGGGAGGVIYEYNITNNQLTPRFTFGPSSNGYRPDCNMTEASNGMLYGTSTAGGTNNGGVLYSFDPISYQYKKLYDFSSTNGSYPRGGLCEVREGLLAGMTWQGGSANRGVLYTFEIKTSTYTLIGSFDGSNGAGPYGSLMKASNGKVYGLTSGISTQTFDGSFFEFDVENKQIKHLKFLPTVARNPIGSLMEASNGKLYATAANDNGSVFEIDPSTVAIRSILKFDCSNGSYPNSGYLVEQSECKMTAFVEMKGPACFGANDAVATVKINSGSYPFRYEWSNGKGFYDFADSLQAGDYTVKIRDGRNCSIEVPFKVEDSVDPGLSFDALPMLCKDDMPYTLKEGHPSGGSYSGTGVTEGKFDPAVSGIGTFTITYIYTKDGCTYEQTRQITVDGCSGIESIQPDWLRVYPNPTMNRVMISYDPLKVQSLEIFDPLGKLVEKRELKNTRLLELGLENLAAGTYSMKFTGTTQVYQVKLIVSK